MSAVSSRFFIEPNPTNKEATRIHNKAVAEMPEGATKTYLQNDEHAPDIALYTKGLLKEDRKNSVNRVYDSAALEVIRTKSNDVEAKTKKLAEAVARITDQGQRNRYDKFKDADLTLRKLEAEKKTEPDEEHETSEAERARKDARKELVDDKEAKDLQSALTAHEELNAAQDELDAAYDALPLPAKVLENERNAHRTTKAELKQNKDFDAKFDDLNTSLPGAVADKMGDKISGLDSKIDNLDAKVDKLNGQNPPEAPQSTSTGSNTAATEAAAESARKEAQKKVLLWGGIPTAVVFIGVVTGLAIALSKQQHQAAHLKALLLNIMTQMQAAQNATPDQSQGAPAPTYGASQNAYGYGPQQYGTAQAGR